MDNFRRVVDFRFGLGRTGLTGRVDRSDRYSWAEKGSIRVSSCKKLELYLAMGYLYFL